MDSIDIVYVHDSDFSGQHPDERFIEALEVVSELRSEGVVQAIGLGMNEWELTTRMIQRFDLDIVLLAGRYTLLDQSALGQLMPLCQARNVAVAIGGPYNSGILASDLNGPVSFDYVAAPPEWISKARRIKEVCDRWGVDVRATALQFPFAHPAVATIIPGASNVREVEENAALLEREIPEGVWDELVNENVIDFDAPVPEPLW
jgi:D-threo-aldose 1-dehydrogenase